MHLFNVECLICFIGTALHVHAVTNSQTCKQPSTTTVLFCRPDGSRSRARGCCGSGCCALHPQFSSQSGNCNHRHFSHKPASLTSGLPPALSTSVTDTQFGDSLCIWRLSTDLCLPSGNEYMEWYGRVVWTLSFIFNTLLPGGDSPVLSAVIAN